MKCMEPECKEDHADLYLRPQCHPGVPTWAIYQKDTGSIVLTCAICGAIATGIKVAKR